MSRTYRRKNESYLKDLYVGTKHEYINCPYNQNEAKRSGLTAEQAYAQRLAWFHGKSKPGAYSQPKWFRRKHGSHHSRRVEQLGLHHALRADQWDNHLPESRNRNTMFRNWF